MLWFLAAMSDVLVGDWDIYEQFYGDFMSVATDLHVHAMSWWMARNGGECDRLCRDINDMPHMVIQDLISNSYPRKQMLKTHHTILFCQNSSYDQFCRLSHLTLSIWLFLQRWSCRQFYFAAKWHFWKQKSVMTICFMVSYIFTCWMS